MPTTSANMSLSIPVLGDATPTYVISFVTTLGLIDAHDHTSGKGVQVPTAGLNINADLSLNALNTTSVRSTRYVSQGSALSGAGADRNCVYVSGGNLYFNNGTGGSVQITSGGGINAAATGGIGGDYTSSAASITYNDTSKTYFFYQAPSTYALMQCSNVTINSTTPGLLLNDTSASAYAYRVGADVNECHISLDTAGTRAVNVNGHLASFPNAAVLNYNNSQPCFGVNVQPSDATFHVANATGGPTYTGKFVNVSDNTLVMIQGLNGSTANNRTACLIFYNGSDQTDIGILSNTGVTNASGAAGDFVIRVNSVENALHIAKSTRNIGLGTGTPQNRLDINGGLAVGAYAGSNAAPTNGAAISGAVGVGTATANGPSGSLTVAAGIFSATAGTGSLGSATWPFSFCAVNASNGYTFPGSTVTFYTSAQKAIMFSGTGSPAVGGVLQINAAGTAILPIQLPTSGTISTCKVWLQQSTTATTTITLYQRLASDGVMASQTTIGSGTLSVATTDTLVTVFSGAQSVAANGYYYLAISTTAAGGGTATVSHAETAVTMTAMPASVRY